MDMMQNRYSMLRSKNVTVVVYDNTNLGFFVYNETFGQRKPGKK